MIAYASLLLPPASSERLVLLHVLASVLVVPGGAPPSRADWKGGIVFQSPTRAPRSSPMATSTRSPGPVTLTPQTPVVRPRVGLVQAGGVRRSSSHSRYGGEGSTPMWQQSTWSSRRRPAWWRTGVLLLICALAACSTTTAKTQHPTHNPTHNPTPAPAPTATFAPCATPTAASSGMPSPTPVPLPPSPSLSLANWHQVASPCVGAEGTLIAVTARSATDAWAVGQYEGSESRQRTLTEHWDGAQWSFVDSPSPGQRYNLLRAVAAVAATDVWAVGSQITASGATQTLALHWDGSAWRLVATPDPGSYANQLNGVATISSSDVWAVGAASKGSLGQVTQQPLIEHWNGTQWSVVTGTPHSVLYAVAAVSSGDVWAVGGFAFDNTGSSTAALIEHWDGHQWTSVPGAPAAATYESLTGIVAISPRHVPAVGHDGFQGCGGPIGGGALVRHCNCSRSGRANAPAPPSL